MRVSRAGIDLNKSRRAAQNAMDKVRYMVHGDEVRIRKVKSIDRLFGALKYDGPPVSLQDMERAIINGATGK